MNIKKKVFSRKEVLLTGVFVVFHRFSGFRSGEEEMKGIVFMLMLVVSFCFVGPTLGAGTVGQSLSESLSLPDLEANWGWNTYTVEEEVPVGGAWVDVRVPYNLSYSSLNYMVSKEDTSIWHAFFNFSGEVSVTDPCLDTKTNNGKIEKGGVKISEYLYTCPDYYRDWVYATASISVSPSTIISGEFRYNEYQYGDSPATWYAGYTVRGKFIAPSEEEARQLGAQFASVPEPSSICLVSVLLLAAGFFRLKKR